jgi:hypothetical protein
MESQPQATVDDLDGFRESYNFGVSSAALQLKLQHNSAPLQSSHHFENTREDIPSSL